MDSDVLIKHFAMRPLEPEGGWFVETWRSGQEVDTPRGKRSLGTAILYLLRAGEFSAMHRLASDELWHFYLGDPAELLLLKPDGSSRIITLGHAVASLARGKGWRADPDGTGATHPFAGANVSAGHQLQAIVPKGSWQGCRVMEGGRFALMGTTVTPGFEPEDLELGHRDELLRNYSDREPMIVALTRSHRPPFA
ncbi:MAG TPA: cupin domain-containing protein [Phycisphaerales bacterium]|nr:cupin domain-containing protein [Phycisphaerales bacterium]